MQIDSTTGGIDSSYFLFSPLSFFLDIPLDIDAQVLNAGMDKTAQKSILLGGVERKNILFTLF
jgi:hypothetical protein